MNAVDAHATPEVILHKAGAEFDVFDHPPIRTYEDIKNTLNLPADSLLKTMAFRAEGGFVLASLPILSRISFGALAKSIGTSRARLQPADDADLAQLGMQIGGVSPLSEVPGTKVLFDTSVSGMGRVYCGSGRADRTISLHVEDLIRVVDPMFGSIAAA